jgi:hypothetical protein
MYWICNFILEERCKIQFFSLNIIKRISHTEFKNIVLKGVFRALSTTIKIKLFLILLLLLLLFTFTF